jgi:hypothetical protein
VLSTGVVLVEPGLKPQVQLVMMVLQNWAALRRSEIKGDFFLAVEMPSTP